MPLMSPALTVDSLPLAPPGKPKHSNGHRNKHRRKYRTNFRNFMNRGRQNLELRAIMAASILSTLLIFLEYL